MSFKSVDTHVRGVSSQSQKVSSSDNSVSQVVNHAHNYADTLNTLHFDSIPEKFNNLVNIVVMLRSDQGCPWDREQDLTTLRDKFIEEVFETVDTIDEHDYIHMPEEIGDVLLHLVMHSVIASELKLFDISTVIDSIASKIIRRHPHVFDKNYGKPVTEENMAADWIRIKEAERVAHHQERGLEYDPHDIKNYSVLQSVPKSLPSFYRIKEIAKKLDKVGLGLDLQYYVNRVKLLTHELYRELDKYIAHCLNADKNNSSDNNSDSRHCAAVLSELIMSLGTIGTLTGLEVENLVEAQIDKLVQNVQDAEVKIYKQFGVKLLEMKNVESDAIVTQIKTKFNDMLFTK